MSNHATMIFKLLLEGITGFFVHVFFVRGLLFSSGVRFRTRAPCSRVLFILKGASEIIKMVDDRIHFKKDGCYAVS